MAVDLTRAGAGAASRLPAALQSPILAVGLASGDTARLEGFLASSSRRTTCRNASAFASIDALLIDAPTLDGLDARQLGALLARAAACDRIVVLNIERAGTPRSMALPACGGRPPDERGLPARGLGSAQVVAGHQPAAPMAFAGIGELVAPIWTAWHQVAVMLGVYVAAMALLLIVGTPAVGVAAGTRAGRGGLSGLAAGDAAPTRLLVWSEGDSGAQIARYQGWRRVAGCAANTCAMPLPPQLASGVRACDAAQPMRFRPGPPQRAGGGGRVRAAAVPSGMAAVLFGHLPMTRALVIDERSGTRGPQRRRRCSTARQLCSAGAACTRCPHSARATVSPWLRHWPLPDSAALRTASARVPGRQVGCPCDGSTWAASAASPRTPRAGCFRHGGGATIAHTGAAPGGNCRVWPGPRSARPGSWAARDRAGR